MHRSYIVRKSWQQTRTFKILAFARHWRRKYVHQIRQYTQPRNRQTSRCWRIGELSTGIQPYSMAYYIIQMLKRLQKKKSKMFDVHYAFQIFASISYHQFSEDLISPFLFDTRVPLFDAEHGSFFIFESSIDNVCADMCLG